MAMRLQETHPALVHFPLTLLPVAIGADLVGRMTDNEPLMELGRRAMPMAVGSAAIAALAGLVAQEEVNVEGESQDMLITHRTINLATVAGAAGLAAWRVSKRRPSALYLGLGLAGIAAVVYSAYLGGKMVYESGVGVKAADGVAKRTPPELTKKNARRVMRRTVTDLRKGVQHLVGETGKGELVPSLRDGRR